MGQADAQMVFLVCVWIKSVFWFKARRFVFASKDTSQKNILCIYIGVFLLLLLGCILPVGTTICLLYIIGV